MPAAAEHCMRLSRSHRCLEQECCCRPCPGAVPVNKPAKLSRICSYMFVFPDTCQEATASKTHSSILWQISNIRTIDFIWCQDAECMRRSC